MAGWKEMSSTHNESDWCSALLLGALGDSPQQFRLRTKDPNLKCFSEGFKTVAKGTVTILESWRNARCLCWFNTFSFIYWSVLERYRDFLVKTGHKKPTKKEVEAVLGKLSRKARDLNGRRNKPAASDTLEVHQRYVSSVVLCRQSGLLYN